MKSCKILFFVLALFSSGFVFTACDSNYNAETEEEVADELAEEREELRADIQEAQREINSRIDKLQANMENASEEASAEMEEQIKKLKAWNNDLDRRLEKLGDDIKGEWNQFKSDASQTLKNINRELDEAFDVDEVE